MRTLETLFANNRHWAAKVEAESPGFFAALAQQQSPQYLWIGCSDSRVPANEIVNLLPGELFVHRNVANVVVHSDLNCLSVIQYAVDVLKVSHIIVCGHYSCGGVAAAMGEGGLGLIDNWLLHVRESCLKHSADLDRLPEPQMRLRRCCELNVIEQVRNVCCTTIVGDAWRRGQTLSVHGWIYDLRDGLLRDLGLCVTRPDELDGLYLAALSPS